MGAVYMLTFASGKSYVGITRQSLMARLRVHRKTVGRANARAVHHAWARHGEPQVEVLAMVPDAELAAAEATAISAYGTLAPGGYNLTSGGESPAWSEESRRRVSAAQKGRAKSEQHRANMIAGAKSRPPVSAASRERNRQSHLGRKQSPEHVAKRTRAQSPATVDKIKATLRARFDARKEH